MFWIKIFVAKNENYVAKIIGLNYMYQKYEYSYFILNTI